jgi:hypothetical protein
VRFFTYESISFADAKMQLARDELQTTMVAETNRKRRKLERDRRAAERPQPGAFMNISLQTLALP